MDIQAQKKKLLDLRKEYTTNLEDVRGRNKNESETEELPVDSDIPTDNADVGSDLFERERALAFTEDYQGVLQMIDRALQKIDQGIYNICDRCGEKIPDERLEALPYALLCIKDEEIEEGL